MDDLRSLREAVYEANMELVHRGLVLYTFGNASGVDRERGLVVIKPSGVSYDSLTPADLVVCDLATDAVVAGDLRPSSDLKTHSALYRAFPTIGGVVHTHSSHATAWCQAGEDLPCYGTTHADYCHGPVPCTAVITPEQVARDYERETGAQITETFAARGLDPQAVPMVLVAGHAPFTWGETPERAAFHAVVLEELARMAVMTRQVNPDAPALPQHVLDKHYERKHGPNAYYGQSH